MLKSVDQCGYGGRRSSGAHGLAAIDYVLGRMRHWQLAVLRFAITLADADRDIILAIASEIDRLGGDISRPTFTYFARTSTEVCHALANADPVTSRATLARYVEQVDDPRLKAVLAVAFELEDGAARRGGRNGRQQGRKWSRPVERAYRLRHASLIA